VPFSKTRSGGRILRTLGALALAIAVLGASPLPATAAEGDDAASAQSVGVATRPAGEDGRPDGRTRFSYTADPGQSVTDRVLVGNTGTQRQDFTVYATDGFNAEDGSFSLLATDETPTTIGTWVTFGNGENRLQFSLEPEEVRLIEFTLQLPAEATPGDHVGGLVASVLEQGAQVNLDRRVATTLTTRVSGELQPQLTVTSFEASYEGDWWNPFGGTVHVRYDVTNPGNVALAANVTTGVNTWFGIPATGDQGSGVPSILPGNSASYEFDAQGVGQWGYLNPGIELNPFVQSDDTSLLLPVPTVRRDAVTFAMPWMLLILVVLAAGVFLLLRWRRRRDEARAEEWIAYTEQQAAAAAAEKAETEAAERAAASPAVPSVSGSDEEPAPMRRRRVDVS
jgi:hypothetical protein